jgi:hypothetical protein
MGVREVPEVVAAEPVNEHAACDDSTCGAYETEACAADRAGVAEAAELELADWTAVKPALPPRRCQAECSKPG